MQKIISQININSIKMENQTQSRPTKRFHLLTHSGFPMYQTKENTPDGAIFTLRHDEEIIVGDELKHQSNKVEAGFEIVEILERRQAKSKDGFVGEHYFYEVSTKLI